MQIKQRECEERVLDCPDLHPVIRRLYATRGVKEGETDLGLAKLIPPAELLNIDVAVDLLERELLKQGRILVVGDFDADGATSSALALLCLRTMGFQHVDYLVPNRFEYGYGLTPEIAAVACTGSPDLLITVDNGISSHEGVDYCREHGVSVLVTDHHLPGETLPNADCILNPNLEDCGFPSKALAGVGVVFYLMLALRARLRETGWFEVEGISEPNLAGFLDIVALGTVADVVPLDHNNRALVRHGLHIIRSGKGRPGIRALLTVAKRDLDVLVAGDLGFAAGPRLNAAGRLDDMSLGIECLLSDDESQAMHIATQLDQLNRERREIEHDMQQEALEILEGIDATLDASTGICLYHPLWHQGVIGILASRLKDRFHKPGIVFADCGGGLIKGSARSVKGLNMRDLLDTIATANPGLIKGFGGHAMAAGLSLSVEDFSVFHDCFQSALENLVDDSMTARVLWTDGVLEQQYLNTDFASALQNAGPWGQLFPEPVFEGVFAVIQQRTMAERHIKFKLDLAEAGRAIDAVAFNVPDAWLQQKFTQVRLAYKLNLNAWAGKVQPQLLIEHLESVPV